MIKQWFIIKCDECWDSWSEWLLQRKGFNPALSNAVFAFPLIASLTYILTSGHCYCWEEIVERVLAMPLSCLFLGLPEWVDNSWMHCLCSLMLRWTSQAVHQISALPQFPDTSLKMEEVKVGFLMWCINPSWPGFLMFGQKHQEVVNDSFERHEDPWTKVF